MSFVCALSLRFVRSCSTTCLGGLPFQCRESTRTTTRAIFIETWINCQSFPSEQRRHPWLLWCDVVSSSRTLRSDDEGDADKWFKFNGLQNPPQCKSQRWVNLGSQFRPLAWHGWWWRWYIGAIPDGRLIRPFVHLCRRWASLSLQWPLGMRNGRVIWMDMGVEIYGHLIECRFNGTGHQFNELHTHWETVRQTDRHPRDPIKGVRTITVIYSKNIKLLSDFVFQAVLVGLINNTSSFGWP